MQAREAANAEAEAAELADGDDVEGWFAQAVTAFSQDELMDLTQRFAKHLGMTLMPLDAMAELTGPVASGPTYPTSNVSVTNQSWLGCLKS
jgi:hypothetical protein